MLRPCDAKREGCMNALASSAMPKTCVKVHALERRCPVKRNSRRQEVKLETEKRRRAGTRKRVRGSMLCINDNGC